MTRGYWLIILSILVSSCGDYAPTPTNPSKLERGIVVWRVET